MFLKQSEFAQSFKSLCGDTLQYHWCDYANADDDDNRTEILRQIEIEQKLTIRRYLELTPNTVLSDFILEVFKSDEETLDFFCGISRQPYDLATGIIEREEELTEAILALKDFILEEPNLDKAEFLKISCDWG